MCGLGAYAQRWELHAFQPKWCSSFPAVGKSTRPTTVPYSADSGSVSMTPSASLVPFSPVLSSATYASVSVGASIARRGEG